MRNGGNTKKRRAKGKSNTDTLATIEDDGTQVETLEEKKKTKRKAGTRRGLSQGAKKTAGSNDAGKKAVIEFVQTTLDTGVEALVAEFEELQKNMRSSPPPPHTAYDSNKERNRYKDVICIDDARVQLTFPPNEEGVIYSDYIHANWVNIDEKRKYICAQGPTERTIVDFWRMVWQEKVETIVMLCNVIEMGKPKCEQYWSPGDGTHVTYGPLTVKTIASGRYEGTAATLTNITVHYKEEEIRVNHYLYNNWPDRGVPADTAPILNMLLKTKRTTTLVHCSAGIGRTGTIVGIGIMYTKLVGGESPTPNFKDLLLEIRKRRHMAVQTDSQYVFMHKVLIDFALRKRLFRQDEALTWMTDYQNLMKSRNTG